MIFSEEWIKHRNLSLKLNFSIMTPRDIKACFMFYPVAKEPLLLKPLNFLNCYEMKIALNLQVWTELPWLLASYLLETLRTDQHVYQWLKGGVSAGRFQYLQSQWTMTMTERPNTTYSVKDVNGLNTICFYSWIGQRLKTSCSSAHFLVFGKEWN